MVDRAEKTNIITLSDTDERFPQGLRHIPSPVKELHIKGDASLLHTPMIAIVGTRTPSSYGLQAARMFARTLAEAGITIVSGLARGIDSAAHIACLEAGGKTIAVLGGGLDKIYPAENARLADRIAASGLIVSEYPVGVGAAAHHFLLRNRIISGLSAGVLIIEAGERSGTLNTASHALAQGKELFALPGSIFSKKSCGTNNLIKDAQGMIVTDPADILELFCIKNIVTAKRAELTAEEQKVIALISETGEVHFNDICEAFSDIGEVLVLLSTMELKGLISKTDGNFYIENK